jgi:Uma2 family endonuclease
MSVAQVVEPITEEQYLRVALASGNAQLEYFDGRIREKPSMSAEHNDAMVLLGFQLVRQLDRKLYRVRINAGRTRRPRVSVFIPDVMVIPAHLERAQRQGPGHLEIYTDALPFVAEFWSPRTGDYDVETKLPEYKERGDREIWRPHPYDKGVTAWRRLPDGSYEELEFRGGKVELAALPGVVIDLDAIFED